VFHTITFCTLTANLVTDMHLHSQTQAVQFSQLFSVINNNK